MFFYPVILRILAFFSSSCNRKMHHPWWPLSLPKISQGRFFGTHIEKNQNRLTWEPTTFIFRGYFTHICKAYNLQNHHPHEKKTTTKQTCSTRVHEGSILRFCFACRDGREIKTRSKTVKISNFDNLRRWWPHFLPKSMTWKGIWSIPKRCIGKKIVSPPKKHHHFVIDPPKNRVFGSERKPLHFDGWAKRVQVGGFI